MSDGFVIGMILWTSVAVLVVLFLIFEDRFTV